jgi:hypothetical protein
VTDHDANSTLDFFDGYRRAGERYNRRDYDGLYAMMAQSTQQVQSKENAVTAMQETVERWGKEQSSQMAIAKLFPGPPVQVRMIYNTTYEKGNAQERFIWTSDGKQAALIQYSRLGRRKNHKVSFVAIAPNTLVTPIRGE